MKIVFLILPMFFACSESKTDDSGLNATGLGTCKHTGDVDGNDGILKVCMEATGSAWELENFIYACESDWDFHATHDSSSDTCPRETLLGTCAIRNGGALIGATFEGDTYGGRFYYYESNELGTGEDHCVRLGGTYASAG